MNISVLMSVYYKENPEYFEEALKSVINQTYKAKQIVIVKDGELTTPLEKILYNYKKLYPNLIEVYDFEGGNGLWAALKFGVEKCKFEYIARMDSDDISLSYRFEKQVERFETDKSLDILGGYIEEYDEAMEKLISIRKVPLELQEIACYIKKQSPFNHGTIMVRKEAIISSGNYNNTQFEDYDLWARMLINGCKMANLDMVLGKNRTGNSMYRRRGGIKRIKGAIEIERNLLKYEIINRYEYVRNTLIRSVFAIVPVGIKKILYKNVIRRI